MTQQDVKNGFCERPPVVAVLGHVDHGKTSLLDRIRQTHVAERETGGITQSIGAYKIDFKGKKITFIDTPGHAAFSKMRARGGQAADLVILVVAADDGVMPQTIESIEHIKAAKVPFLVAINKIDLPGADVEKVKKQLSDNGVLLESYGGEVVALPVSAKTGEGIDELLEMVLLLSQMGEVSGDPKGILQGIVIESKKEKAGPVGTVVVKNGTLAVGDEILAGGVFAKVKGLMDEFNQRLTSVGPGEPAEVLGFSSPPPVGAKVVKVEAQTKQTPSELAFKLPQFSQEEKNKFKIILKADSTGSLEALSSNLSQDVLLVLAGVGDISDSDVLLAQTLGAKIFGFRVKVSSEVAKLAESEKIVIKTYKIIYQFLEDIEKEILATARESVQEEKILGKAEIIAQFQIDDLRIAGCRVTEGKLRLDDTVHLERGGKVVGESQVASLQQRAKSVKEAKNKDECGVLLSSTLDFKIGDVLISVTQINE